MLQSPAPALIRIAPPLSGPSMNARSRMVPSCMLNSRSGPVCIQTHTVMNRFCSENSGCYSSFLQSVQHGTTITNHKIRTICFLNFNSDLTICVCFFVCENNLKIMGWIVMSTSRKSYLIHFFILRNINTVSCLIFKKYAWLCLLSCPEFLLFSY